mgnify:CR=1 FL=1
MVFFGGGVYMSFGYQAWTLCAAAVPQFTSSKQTIMAEACKLCPQQRHPFYNCLRLFIYRVCVRALTKAEGKHLRVFHCVVVCFVLLCFAAHGSYWDSIEMYISKCSKASYVVFLIVSYFMI